MPKLGPRFRKTTSARKHSEGTDITDAPLTNRPDPFYRSENTRLRKGEMTSTWRTQVIKPEKLPDSKGTLARSSPIVSLNLLQF